MEDSEDADVEADTVKTTPRVKRKRGGRKHTAIAKGDSPEVVQAVQLSDALPMEKKAPATPDMQKDVHLVSDAEPEVDLKIVPPRISQIVPPVEVKEDLSNQTAVILRANLKTTQSPEIFVLYYRKRGRSF